MTSCDVLLRWTVVVSGAGEYISNVLVLDVPPLNGALKIVVTLKRSMRIHAANVSRAGRTASGSGTRRHSVLPSNCAAPELDGPAVGSGHAVHVASLPPARSRRSPS